MTVFLLVLDSNEKKTRVFVMRTSEILYLKPEHLISLFKKLV